MGRQLRRVTENWQHPKNKDGNYIPLFDGEKFKKQLSDWEEGERQWNNGFKDDWNDGWKPKENDEINMSYEEWSGGKPLESDYMPQWSEEEKTHIQLYEDTTEGTPKSPVFKADEFEKLCEYASKNISVFANDMETQEEWADMLKNDFVHLTQGKITFI